MVKTINFIQRPASKASLSRRSPIYGKGINDANYLTQNEISGKKVSCPYYKIWTAMLTRCYSKDLHKIRPTYIGCTVCSEWLLFSTFKGWMEKQDWIGKQLDKDILIKGNKIYSPESCIFIYGYINTLFADDTSRRGKYKIGVSRYGKRKKYTSSCSVKGKLVNIGKFDSELDAHEAYKKFKYNIIFDIANKQTEPLKSALLAYRIDEQE